MKRNSRSSGIHRTSHCVASKIVDRRGRLGIQLRFIILIIIKRVLVSRIAKEMRPFSRVNARRLVHGDSCKPIIKHDMKGGSDGTRVRVQNKRDGTGMVGRQSHVDGALRTGFPAR